MPLSESLTGGTSCTCHLGITTTVSEIHSTQLKHLTQNLDTYDKNELIIYISNCILSPAQPIFTFEDTGSMKKSPHPFALKPSC